MRIILTLMLCIFSLSASNHTNLSKFSESLDFAQVTKVIASKQNGNMWCFSVSVNHNDEGWDHYANAWEVLDLKANLLASRILFHPHEKEQPFTRSLCSVKIPSGISKVIIRARCNKHGFGGKVILLDLNK